MLLLHGRQNFRGDAVACSRNTTIDLKTNERTNKQKNTIDLILLILTVCTPHLTDASLDDWNQG